MLEYAYPIVFEGLTLEFRRDSSTIGTQNRKRAAPFGGSFRSYAFITNESPTPKSAESNAVSRIKRRRNPSFSTSPSIAS